MTGCRHVRLDALAVMAVFLGVEMLAEQAPVEPTGSGPSRNNVSARINEALREKLPKFKARDPATSAGVESATESSDGTMVLPTMTVSETLVLPPPEAVITPKGRLDQAMKAHPGLKIGNLFGLNNGTALALQQEEREARKKAALDDLVQYLAVENTPDARKLKAEMKAAKQLPNTDWLAGRR